MTTDTMPTGIDIASMARDADIDLDTGTVSRYDGWHGALDAFAGAVIEHAASIAERMGLEAQSDEAKRLAVEIGAAIRSEVA